MGVPLFASSLEPYYERIAERQAEVVRSGRYILGPEVAAFEDDARVFGEAVGAHTAAALHARSRLWTRGGASVCLSDWRESWRTSAGSNPS